MELVAFVNSNGIIYLIYNTFDEFFVLFFFSASAYLLNNGILDIDIYIYTGCSKSHAILDTVSAATRTYFLGLIGIY